MTTHPGRWCLLIAFAAIVATPDRSLATTQVSYCGQSFRGHGVLTGNLDCTGFGGSGVTVERGRLDLNGFTISNAAQFGVHCLTTCQIVGPGSITANGLDGIRTEGWAAVRGATISNNALNGINARNYSTASRVLISESVISGNGFNGIESDSAVSVRRSTVSANNGNGIDVGVPQCDTTGRVLLFRSTVTGNATMCVDSPVCADITSSGRNQRAPRVRKSSTCNKSYVRESGSPGQTWGVCSQD